MFEEGAEGLLGVVGEGGFGEGVVHEGDPAVAGKGVDGEGGVALAEAGVAALFDVGGWAAEAEDEEVAEAGFGAGKVVGGVHGAEDVVGGDLAVEGGDEAAEAVLADGFEDVVFGEGGLHVLIIAPTGRNVPPAGQVGA